MVALVGADAHAAEVPPLTAEDVGAFLDGLVPPALQRGGIPGGVAMVVKDGAVLVERGYGLADAASHRPVDPERTLFRPGSISKTFTWTAVMQLVEAGKLDLDRDVDAYLDFRIPDAWGKPITLRQLMTHSAGFEDRVEDIVYWDAAAALSNEQYVKSWIPTRIYPPGTVIAYSNYGAALAGYIVQRASGEPFEDYVQDHILQPLGMSHSTFRQPLPASLVPDMATGYLPDGVTARPFEFIAPAPAGALSTTAGDMARFMIAQLQDGRLGETRILQEPTARLMHAEALQPSPAVNGVGLGFRHEDRNGQTIIAHAGGTILFQSDMHLFLDAQVGLFISLNSQGADGEADKLRRALLEQFSDRYFPQARPDEPSLPTAPEHGRLAAGYYQVTQRSEDNLGAFFGLLNQARLTADADGVITIGALLDAEGKPRRWREVAPFIWRALDSTDRLAMQVKDGRVEAILAPPLYTFQPVPGWSSAAWNVKLLIGALAVFALAVVAWPLSALARLAFKRPRRLQGAPLLRHRLVRMACLAELVFLAGLPLFLSAVAAGGFLALTGQIDPWLRVLQLCGVLGTIGTIAALYDTLRGPGLLGRLSNAAIALAGGATLWLALAFHLFSWDLNF